MTTGSDLPRTVRLHGDMVEAIELGDLELAAHRLDVHFFDVRQRISRLPTLTGPQDDHQQVG